MPLRRAWLSFGRGWRPSSRNAASPARAAKARRRHFRTWRKAANPASRPFPSLASGCVTTAPGLFSLASGWEVAAQRLFVSRQRVGSHCAETFFRSPAGGKSLVRDFLSLASGWKVAAQGLLVPRQRLEVAAQRLFVPRQWVGCCCAETFCLSRAGGKPLRRDFMSLARDKKSNPRARRRRGSGLFVNRRQRCRRRYDFCVRLRHAFA